MTNEEIIDITKIRVVEAVDVFGPLFITVAIMAALKINGYMDITWFWVLSPFALVVAVALIAISACIIGLFIGNVVGVTKSVLITSFSKVAIQNKENKKLLCKIKQLTWDKEEAERRESKSYKDFKRKIEQLEIEINQLNERMIN